MSTARLLIPLAFCNSSRSTFLGFEGAMALTRQGRFGAKAVVALPNRPSIAAEEPRREVAGSASALPHYQIDAQPLMSGCRAAGLREVYSLPAPRAADRLIHSGHSTQDCPATSAAAGLWRNSSLHEEMLRASARRMAAILRPRRPAYEFAGRSADADAESGGLSCR
jgi:hypothetical protein